MSKNISFFGLNKFILATISLALVSSMHSASAFAAPRFVVSCNVSKASDFLGKTYGTPGKLVKTKSALSSHYVMVNEGGHETCLHYVEAGRADRPLVVLLHGVPEFWYGWRNQIDPLVDAGFHVVIPDLPGMNESSRPTEIDAFFIENLARDVADLIAAAGHEKAHVAGYDIGAAVAWSTAMFQPARVEKLVIVDGPHPALWRKFLVDRRDATQFDDSGYAFQWAFHGEFFSRAMTSMGQPGIEATMRALSYRSVLNPEKRPNPVDAVTDFDIKLYSQALSRPRAVRNVMRYYESILVWADRITEADVAGYVGDFQLPRNLAKAVNGVFFNLVDVNNLTTGAIKAWERIKGVAPGDAGFKPNSAAQSFPMVHTPTLAMFGERDPYLNAKLFTDLNELREVAIVVDSKVIANHGHWLLEEAPQEVAQSMIEFLSR